MEEHKMVNIFVIWRGKKFDVEINSGATLKEFGQKLQQLTNVQSDTMRLLVPRSSDSSSKLITPFSCEHSILSLKDSSILEGKSIRMMGVFEDEVKEVSQNGTKADQRIAGFDEEERRLKQRMLTKPATPLRLPKGAYIFCDFRTLHLPGIELTPPASDALKRMHMLAADPGIVSIMNKHRWRVGVMTEMAPVGYVGVSPKCILGYNKNQGEEISLRLRTDDLKGFRKYESIKRTLLHELAHMVYSEHDADFFALDKQLNQEAVSLDWTRSRSHTLNGVKRSDQYEEVFDEETTGSSSQKLGGKINDDMATARAASVAAAYHRLAVATIESVQEHEVDVKPHPDYSGCKRHDEPDEYMETEPFPRILGTEILPELELSGTEARTEPDPDDSLASKTVLKKVLTEPDPDDHLSNEILDRKTHISPSDDATERNNSGCWNFVEPDPDDSLETELKEYAKMENKLQEEPDPDESGFETATFKYGNDVEPDPDDSGVETTTFKCGNHVEPDADDVIANRIMQHSGSQATRSGEDMAMVDNMQKEPDPDPSDMKRTIQNVEHYNDDSMVNEISQHEPVPGENSGSIMDSSSSLHDLPDQHDQELQRIQDPVSVICSHLQKYIEMLKSEVHPAETTLVVQTLFKIIRNVVEHPEEIKYRRLRKANPHFQKTVAKYKAAMEILFLVGFKEDAVANETFVVLKRNDPGLLWLAKSTLEMCIAAC